MNCADYAGGSNQGSGNPIPLASRPPESEFIYFKDVPSEVPQVLVQREISCQYPLNFVVDGCFILEGGPFGGSCLTNFGKIHATLQAVRGGHRITKPAFRTDFHIPSLPFEKTIALKLTRDPLYPQFYRPKAGCKPVLDLYFQRFSCEFGNLSWFDPAPQPENSN